MVTIETSEVDYGGFVVHHWTLVQKVNGETRSWHLGQDVKFCSRVLGMETGYVARCIGDNDLRNPRTRRRLASFILAQLNMTSRDLRNTAPWQLCAE